MTEVLTEQVTIARALTKMKIIKSRIKQTIDQIASNAAVTTKTLSPLSKEKSIDKNHKEAAEKLASMIQSVMDMQNYYIAATTAIQESNLKTTIVAETMGELTIANALVLVQKLHSPTTELAKQVQMAAASAELAAQKYNTSTRIKPESFKDADPKALEALDALTAHPLVLINPDTAATIITKSVAVREELHGLINASNAVTMITVPKINLIG